jgi:hypothetical protein
MSNADVADTMPSMLAIDEPAVIASRSLSNWAVAPVLVGALSAFAAVGVVISEYLNPDPPAPVAVAPNVASIPAPSSAPASAIPAANVHVPPATVAGAAIGSVSSAVSRRSQL